LQGGGLCDGGVRFPIKVYKQKKGERVALLRLYAVRRGISTRLIRACLLGFVGIVRITKGVQFRCAIIFLFHIPLQES